jgi:Protein of unknown function (DUF3159)
VTAPQPPEERTDPTLLEQLGGLSGVVASVIPVIVFVLLNAIAGFLVALWAALASAVVIAVLRLVRRERLQPAVSGAIGVGICAFIAYRVGEAKGFFLLGIWASLAYAALFAVSLLVRYPLVGVIWHGLRGDGQQRWRADRRIVRAYDVATLIWVLVFVARFAVQRWLYDNDETNALGIARLAMGLPLTVVASAVTVWAARKAGRLLADEPLADEPAQPQPIEPATGPSPTQPSDLPPRGHPGSPPAAARDTERDLIRRSADEGGA